MPISARPCSRLAFVESWAEHADRPALIADQETITYTELGVRVATEMELLGSTRRLVLIEMQNTVSAIVSYLAALRAGHVVLMASDVYARESLTKTFDPDVVFASRADVGWRMVEHRAGTRHDLHADLALLMSTSGSTGSPKVVRLSRENLNSNAESIADYLDIDSTDRAMTSLPLSYCYGLSVLHSHLARGAAVIVTRLSVVDPGFWDLANTAQATAFAGVPYTFELLDRVGFADLDLPTLRYVTQAGGKLGADLVRKFAELGRSRGWDLVVMYGQTEATARMAYVPVDRVLDAPEAVGVPIPGGRFAIDDDGELIYHGANVMLGYAESPHDFALGRTVDRLRTGDLARLRPDGLYEIVGRRSRFLKILGLRVDLDQLEQGLRVAGIPALCTGDDSGLIVAVTKATPNAATVVGAKAGLPATAVRTLVLDDLPRYANGKPDYAALLRRSADPPPGEPVTGGGVRAIYREILKVDEVGDTDTFVDLGGDSLSFVQTSQRLESRLGTLPTDWHLLSVAGLEAGARVVPRGPVRWMETSTVLRAVAIVMICANHVGLSHVLGGAHVLLAVAGYSFARFQLTAIAASGRVRPLFASIARIGVPSVVVIAIAYLTTREYDVWNMLLIENLFAPVGLALGPDGWDPVWNYWFIEVLVVTLVLFAALLSIPAVRRLERAHAFGFALAVLGVCLVLRFQLVGGDVLMEGYRPQTTVWLFALGWAAVRATRVSHRLLLTVAAVCGASLPGFFDGEHGRKLVILGGLLLLVWVTRLPVPVVLRRLTAMLAGASLWIYLTQPQTFYLLEWAEGLFGDSSAAGGAASVTAQSGFLHDLRLVAATIIALVVGLLAWKVYEASVRRLVRLQTGRSTAQDYASPKLVIRR
jgi:acyl-CoA synthetase (AMP-forming)/AMP-acid ligase II